MWSILKLEQIRLDYYFFSSLKKKNVTKFSFRMPLYISIGTELSKTYMVKIPIETHIFGAQ